MKPRPLNFSRQSPNSLLSWPRWLSRYSFFALALLFAPELLAEAERSSLNMPVGVTEVSREIYGLHMTIFWWCVAIGVVVFGVMFYSMLVHRKDNDARPAQFHESATLEVLWTLIPAAILVAMAWPATKTLFNIYDHKEGDIDVLITGYQWKWKYEYLDTDVSFFSNLSTASDEIYNRSAKNPNYLLEVDEPLVLPIGKKIRFLITANDVIHAWWVPDLAVKRDAIPGFINEAWTRIEEPGVYRGQCAELCGKDHGFMPIVVKAVEQEEYDTWVSEREAKAQKLRALTEKTFTKDELMARGEQVYGSVCAACHQVDGKGLPPTFPAIAQSPIATGDMTEHLDIVINGSAKNPAMRAFAGELSEVDLAAVITYQRNGFGNNTGDLIQPIEILQFKEAK